mmetsp:Transcript_84438/g.225612  ORF Transcript_84438/g.225612 Transcript_84438/m.225612 type:complete len:304 (+) Transcript_84438:919-1830(+)
MIFQRIQVLGVLPLLGLLVASLFDEVNHAAVEAVSGELRLVTTLRSLRRRRLLRVIIGPRVPLAHRLPLHQVVETCHLHLLLQHQLLLILGESLREALGRPLPRKSVHERVHPRHGWIWHLGGEVRARIRGFLHRRVVLNRARQRNRLGLGSRAEADSGGGPISEHLCVIDHRQPTGQLLPLYFRGFQQGLPFNRCALELPAPSVLQQVDVQPLRWVAEVLIFDQDVHLLVELLQGLLRRRRRGARTARKPGHELGRTGVHARYLPRLGLRRRRGRRRGSLLLLLRRLLCLRLGWLGRRQHRR